MEPAPGRDKSRPYIPSSFLKVHNRVPTAGYNREGNVYARSSCLFDRRGKGFYLPGMRETCHSYRWGNGKRGRADNVGATTQEVVRLWWHRQGWEYRNPGRSL